MSEELVTRRFNPDFSTYLAGGIGVMALIGLALWYRYSGSQTFATDVARNAGNPVGDASGDFVPLGTPEPDFGQQFSAVGTLEVGGEEDIFERTYFGYPVFCGMLNTNLYGHGESVDPDEPIFDSAEAIFGAMGDRVNRDTKVMVAKGEELIFRDSESGEEYSVDANGTMYCRTRK